jgi:hypothetical protein
LFNKLLETGDQQFQGESTMKLKRWLSYFYILLMLSLFSNCTGLCQSGRATELANLTESTTSLTYTLSATLPLSSTVPTRTMTPLPTLSPEDALVYVSEMIQTNGGCELPCWWGIVPGESRWIDTKRFFEPFALEIDENNSGFGEHLVVYPHPTFGRAFTTFYVEDGIIYLLNTLEYISIYDSLEIFGIPEEVWVFSTGNIQGSAELDLELFYPSHGILIDYGSTISPGYSSDNILHFCSKDFNDQPGFGLSRHFLWSPGYFSTFDYFTQYLPRLEPPSRYARISEVSSLNEDSFFELFSTDPDACFDTANDIWTKKLLPTMPPAP